LFDSILHDQANYHPYNVGPVGIDIYAHFEQKNKQVTFVALPFQQRIGIAAIRLQ
jgi:hypothetical protein